MDIPNGQRIYDREVMPSHKCE